MNIYQKFVNAFSADVIPEPKLKYHWLRLFSNNKLGKRVAISPLTRVNKSRIGDDVNLGVRVHIKDSEVGANTVVGANVLIKNAKVGENCFLASNAIVTEDVPKNSLVIGKNKCRPWLKKKDPPTHRNIKKLRRYDYSPVWHWTQGMKTVGAIHYLSLFPFQFCCNTIAHLGHSNKAKVKLGKIYCRIHPTADIHYNVFLDSLFPDNVRVDAHAVLERSVVLLSHSFIDTGGYVLERGIVHVGEGCRIGYHTVLLPGVEVPPDTHIPKYCTVSSTKAYSVLEDKYYTFEELKN